MTAPRLVLSAAACALLLAACSRPAAGPPAPRPAPWIVIGVDGGELSVIETLWARGELPNLRRLADAGLHTRLATDYGASPVIWTTIATGMPPGRHGITDFVVPTDAGDVPVSSAARKVPALWSMLSRAHRRVAVLGWWASWPAEPVDGLVLTDRLAQELPQRIYPPERQAELEAAHAEARESGIPFGGNDASQLQDRLVTRFAVEAVQGDYALVLPYYRSLDLASHQSWRLYEPAAFGDPVPARPGDDPVSAAYRAVDQAVGEILAAAPPEANVLVISDHGFRATHGEEVQLLLDLDRVLEAAGLLVRAGEEVDLERSRAFAYRSPDYRAIKFVRFAPEGSDPEPAALERARRELGRTLARATFDGGAPAFRVRPPDEREAGRGAHAVVVADKRAATPTLYFDGAPVRHAIRHLGRISGSHDSHTKGILFAAGPAIQPGAVLPEVTIHDIAPTLLFALGLPVAEDFPGHVRDELFRPEFAASRPRRTIASWGEQLGAETPRSAADRTLLDELAALGYLN